MKQMLRNIPANICYNPNQPVQYPQPQPQYFDQYPYPGQPQHPNVYPPSQPNTSSSYSIDTSKIVLLKDCNPKDIVHITKNRILQQTTIKAPLVSKQRDVTFKRPETKPKQVSQQYQLRQNEELFNYQKLMKEKKDRKQKFLSDIERKISQAEREADDLEGQFKEEEKELKNIDSLQERLNEKFKNQLVNEEVSKIQKEIEEREEESKHRRIQINMEINEIKQVIQNQEELGQRVIDEADEVINRARGIKPPKPVHVERTKQKPQRPQKIPTSTVSSFNMTKKQM